MILRSTLTSALIGGIAAFSLASSAIAAPLKVDAGKSTVSAVFKQLNVPVEAKFKKFTAQIDFDSAKPDAAKASVDIDIASFDLGDAEYNKEVLKKEWFNAAQFPKASFVSSSIKAAAGAPAGTKYDVTGKLTIKGKTADVRFPLTVKKEGNGQVFDGAVPIKRLTFNIGEGEWKDTGMVADEVTIKFHVVTAP
ncbi:polyisoprenoid-binding protein [Herbaspirillum sp. meg3]|jgi:polyisoprenoid-binding protein YceI|uniref:YceI family protein n=1 Tax=Herbaspirillum sp. meg3 TaxID=2025949 RepID=UPI000B97F00B|nr:YceI family protein [Herbaspirillum sp. meg3]ASU40354.1 polyisoprenoid-binding protein [Herbaspirillum sp. meg3]